LDEDKSCLLEELTKSVVWMGRYSVPKKRERLATPRVGDVRKWHDVVKLLLADIRCQLPRDMARQKWPFEF